MSDHLDPVVLKAALSRLKTRERFREELQGWLLQQGFDAHEVVRALDYCAAKLLQSDKRALEAHVARAKAKGRSADQLAAELDALGVGSDLRESARNLMLQDELGRACQLLRKRGRADEPPERAARYLCTKGFDEDTVRAAVEAVLGSFSDP